MLAAALALFQECRLYFTYLTKSQFSCPLLSGPALPLGSIKTLFQLPALLYTLHQSSVLLQTEISLRGGAVSLHVCPSI